LGSWLSGPLNWSRASTAGSASGLVLGISGHGGEVLEIASGHLMSGSL
jgi:hypothetical protein